LRTDSRNSAERHADDGSRCAQAIQQTVPVVQLSSVNFHDHTREYRQRHPQVIEDPARPVPPLGDREVREARVVPADGCLRREQAVILRMRSSGESTFVSTLEVHGEYDAAEESTIGSEGSIAAIEHFGDGHNQLVKIVSRQRGERYLTLSYDPDDDLEHAIRVAGREFVWSGFYGLFDRNGPLVSKHSN